MKFVVITRVPGSDSVGNMAIAAELRFVDPHDPLKTHQATDAIGVGAWLQSRMPVFRLGEVVILDGPFGREMVGPQRKPSKWDVDTEEFDTIEEAVARAQEVLDAEGGV